MNIDIIRDKIRMGTATADETREFDVFIERTIDERLEHTYAPENEVQQSLDDFWGVVDRQQPQTNRSIGQRRFYLAAAAVLTFILATVFAVIQWNDDALNQSLSLLNKMSLATSEHSVTYSGRNYIRLPDGSSVTLNEGSEIIAPHSFGQYDRTIELVGEAYFDVFHEEGKPFIVKTALATVTVLGTAFNVKAYLDSQIVVTVARGRVAVRGNNGEAISLVAPHQQLVVKSNLKYSLREEVMVEEVVPWIKEMLVFDNARLEDVMKSIEFRYNVKMVFNERELGNCPLTATFRESAELGEVLRAIARLYGATYTISGDQVIFVGRRPCRD